MIEVDQLTPMEWSHLSEKAHLVTFNEHKPKEWDRIDFALVVRRGDNLLAYLTAREVSHETLYWQFGGAFPGTRETSVSYVCYRALIDFCRGKYKRITTLVENNNTVMLKMALKAGFLIVGTKCWNNSVMVELCNEL